MTIRYKRVLLKLSGEALMGNDAFGINRTTIMGIVGQIVEIAKMGVEVGVVVGGGNLFAENPQRRVQIGFGKGGGQGALQNGFAGGCTFLDGQLLQKLFLVRAVGDFDVNHSVCPLRR